MQRSFHNRSNIRAWELTGPDVINDLLERLNQDRCWHNGKVGKPSLLKPSKTGSVD
jgi:hypothetical protein